MEGEGNKQRRYDERGDRPLGEDEGESSPQEETVLQRAEAATNDQDRNLDHNQKGNQHDREDGNSCQYADLEQIAPTIKEPHGVSSEIKDITSGNHSILAKTKVL